MINSTFFKVFQLPALKFEVNDNNNIYYCGCKYTVQNS